MSKTKATSQTTSQAKKTAKTQPKKDQAQQTKPLIADNEKVTITLAWSELEPAYHRALVELAKNSKIEGFRQGKAPINVVEQRTSLDKLIEPTLKTVLPKKYLAAIQQAKKQAITAPEYRVIKVAKDQDWVIDAYFCQAPAIDLKGYKQLVAKGRKAAQQFINKRNAELAKTKRKPAKTEKKSAESAASKKATQEATKQQLSADQEQEIYYQHILRELTMTIRPSIGELLLRRETQVEFDQFRQQLESYKMTVDDYLKQRQIDLNQLSNELAGTVLNRLQIDFILAAIARQEKLEISQQELDQELTKVKDEKLRSEIKNNQSYLDNIKAQLLRRKTLESLLSNKAS